MYITVMRKNAMIKNIKMALALCLPAFIIQVLFNNYLLSALVFVYNFEIAITLYVFSRKQLMRKFWVNALILIGYSVLGCYLPENYIASMGFVLISSFMAFYILKFKTTIQSQILKYAIVDYLIFSFVHSTIQGHEWVIIVIGGFGLISNFLINFFIFPETNFLYISNVHKRFVNAYRYYTKQLLSLSKHKNINHFRFKRHQKVFHQDYLDFMSAVTDLPKNYEFSKTEMEELYRDVALHHLVIKKFNILEESVVALIEYGGESSEMVDLIQKFLRSFQLCLMRRDGIALKKMDSIFRLIYSRLQTLQHKLPEKIDEMSNLLFAIRGLESDLEKIHKQFLGGVC